MNYVIFFFTFVEFAPNHGEYGPICADIGPIFGRKWAEKRAHLRQKWADIGAWGRRLGDQPPLEPIIPPANTQAAIFVPPGGLTAGDALLADLDSSAPLLLPGPAPTRRSSASLLSRPCLCSGLPGFFPAAPFLCGRTRPTLLRSQAALQVAGPRRRPPWSRCRCCHCLRQRCCSG